MAIFRPCLTGCQNIWQHGSRFATSQLITQATGEDLNIRYFREHLTSRYL
jgi:carboxypeptidase Taq